ncbi:MAG: hypothetical protein NZ952_04450, partial [Candidatus Bathyarchaeota archaeon]|nr:hypothetical protein [Candidatus Bathyarchaeota archaeon]
NDLLKGKRQTAAFADITFRKAYVMHFPSAFRAVSHSPLLSQQKDVSRLSKKYLLVAPVGIGWK